MVKNELDQVLKRNKKEKKKSLVAYLAGGYPVLPQQNALIAAMEQAGVDAFEIGIPFSDPIADGPTIQFASQSALDNGATLTKILAWIGKLTKKTSTPILVMGYMNPFNSYGFAKFARDAAKAGVKGVIVPDLIPEEADEFRRTLSQRNIHLIHLVAPTTPFDRQKSVAKQTGGFLYAVSIAGVTGARRSLPTETKKWLSKLRRVSPAPVLLGFGISGPAQVKEFRESVDGFIVGSAFVDIIRKNNASRRPSALASFVKGLSKECRHGR